MPASADSDNHEVAPLPPLGKLGLRKVLQGRWRRPGPPALPPSPPQRISLCTPRILSLFFFLVFHIKKDTYVEHCHYYCFCSHSAPSAVHHLTVYCISYLAPYPRLFVVLNLLILLLISLLFCRQIQSMILPPPV